MGVGDQVVVVTGGCGFVGQHVVKQLLEQKLFPVKELRVFDLCQNFTWVKELEVEDVPIPLKHVTGDITKPEHIVKACEGATMVIHTAGKIDVSACPDDETLNLVNVSGTENVLRACYINSVRILVFTSTVDVVIGNQSIINGTESTTSIPKSHHFGPYASTKCKAEKLILESNNIALANNEKLRTCALRISPVYGEGDPNYSRQMKSSKKQGKMMRISAESSMLQHVYAGNVGYAHALAAGRLCDPDFPSGRAYFITDDTPVSNLNQFLSPFLDKFDIPTSSFLIPYWILYTLAFITELIAWILKPLNLFRPIFTTRVVRYLNSVCYFNSNLAKLELDYKPLYSYDEAFERSLKYYQRYIFTP